MASFEMTTGRVLSGTLVETLLLTLVIAILHARGWNMQRLGPVLSALGRE
jgi:hypothetical protein